MHIDTNSPPDAVNNSLTRRALDEPLRLTQDGHLNRVPDPIFQVIIVLFASTRQKPRWCAGVDGPSRGQYKRKLQHVMCMFAQGTHGENLAEVGTSAGQRGGSQVTVSKEVDAVEEQTEDDRHVAVFLEGRILFE